MTNNPTIDGVSRELLRKQFEEKNEHRGWFVPDGIAEADTPEGFVYSDFTTDMCWTCYFEANAALQSTIARLESRITQLESEAEFAAATYQAARDRISELESGLGGMLFAFDDGVGRGWSEKLLDYARQLTPAVEFDATAALNGAGK